MTFSEDCLNLVKQSEGCQLHAYKDSAGVLTIGWGHTGRDVMADSRWTQAQADAQLAADLQIAAEAVAGAVRVPLTQGQFDALTDFTFNMGAGTLRKSTLLNLLNAGQYSQVPNQLVRQDEDGDYHRIVFAGGKVLPGLVTRRQREVELWNKENT